MYLNKNNKKKSIVNIITMIFRLDDLFFGFKTGAIFFTMVMYYCFVKDIFP